MKKLLSCILTLVMILGLFTVNASAMGSAGFIDVPTDAYYSEPVLWAVEGGITNGIGNMSFGPDNTCTRAQILTFLWRAVGSPATAIDNPYTDVNENHFYYQSALWAYENGMIEGTEFSGNTPCTRAEVVTYQWKLAGSPDGYTHSFTDVPADAAYSQAVAWAVAEGITNGNGVNTFGPDGICTRGQIVTFLWRDLAEKTLYQKKSANEIHVSFQCAKNGKYLSFSDTKVVLSDTPTEWTPKPAKNKFYYVYATGTAMLLDIHNAWIEPGTTVGIWGLTGYDAQIWKIAINADGSVSFLSSENPKLCLGFSSSRAKLEKRAVGNQYQEFKGSVTTMTTTEWCEIKSDDGIITLQLEARAFDVITPERALKWANDLSTAYDSFEELTGTRPHDKIILRGFEMQEYYAFVMGTDTIYYDKDCLYEDLEKMAVRENDWCFGALHEMGHMFDCDMPWNFEAECLTDLKVPYVMEMHNAEAATAQFPGDVTFTGEEAMELYNQLRTDISESYDIFGLCYRFLEIKNDIGWEPFKETFHYMESNYLDKAYTSNAQRWEDFMSLLSQFSGKDVLSYFSDAELKCILDYID